MATIEKKMKLIKSKKGALGGGMIALIVIGLVIFVGLPLGGIIKFMFTDKTPLIIGGILLLLVLIGKRKRG